MRRHHWILAFVIGLAVLVAGCGSSTPNSSAPPSAAPAQTPSAEATAAVVVTTTTDAALDAYPMLAGYQGHFTGSWNDSTFGTTGSMIWDLTADSAARTVEITVNVGGRFFGGTGAPPESIKLTHLAQGVINGTSAAFGGVSGTITPDGTLTITLTKLPGGLISKVEIMGTFTGNNTISMAYTVSFAAGGAAATGTVKLNRG
jgi:hypothetical protein